MSLADVTAGLSVCSFHDGPIIMDCHRRSLSSVFLLALLLHCWLAACLPACLTGCMFISRLAVRAFTELLAG